MTPAMPVPARFFASVDDLRAWFQAHHSDSLELWIGFYKAHTERTGVVYTEAVDEALCFGWIDTTVRRIDEDRYANRFTPRRPESAWSEANRHRFAELDRAGRVTDAGRRAFERRPENQRPQYTSGQTFLLSPEFSARLRDEPSAQRFFDSRNRSYRNRAAFWVMSAVRPETRERRFVLLLEASASATIPAALLLPGEVAPRPVPPPGGPAQGSRPRAKRRRSPAAGRR
ncbi:MAG TPA: YdeI/OmpD-associated family protein [Thermoplasmata archaeon]|nr:YdeI/OmpD-associated family protein [Thermoplasmata archaeon]